MSWTVVDMDEARLKKDANELLARAVIGRAKKHGPNTVYPIILESEIIGQVRERVDLGKLDIGRIRRTWHGRVFELLDNGIVVGKLRD